ncbi:MAG TPA: hypothetical protein VMF88_15855 [Bacteroidota bacterium]|nr:hypothetical protein [Bacteroidota bacterium]
MKTGMKYLFIIVIAFAFFSSSAFAQKSLATMTGKQDPSSIAGGLGLTWINGQEYYLVNIAPDLAFGNFGVGLDINLLIGSTDHKIRKVGFDSTAYDYLRMIRYLRWGHKGDDVYARVGTLDYAQLGHGFIMYLYNNSPSYDARRLGSEFDLSFGKYGLETVYGDFGRLGVVGVRAHVDPLKFTTIGSVPVLGGLELGATWAGDLRRDSKDTGYTVANGVPTASNTGGIDIVGADIGFPLVRVPTVSSTLYADYAKILSFGSGEAVGLQTDFSGLGLVNIFTKFERRWTGEEFIANYFDTFYELDRYNLAGTVFSSKAQMLENVTSAEPGFFGDLTFAILGKLQIRGTYSKLDKVDTSGTLHIGTSTGSMIPIFIVDAGYDKKYIKNGKDVFTLDQRSLLYASIGYKPYPFMIVSMLYTWTFEPVVDANGNTYFTTQKRVEPKVSLVFPL